MAYQEINWDRLKRRNAEKMTEFVRVLHIKTTTVLMAAGCGTAFLFGHLVKNDEGFIGGLLGYILGIPLLQFFSEYPKAKKAFDKAAKASEDEYVKIDAIIAANKLDADAARAAEDERIKVRPITLTQLDICRNCEQPKYEHGYGGHTSCIDFQAR